LERGTTITRQWSMALTMTVEGNEESPTSAEDEREDNTSTKVMDWERIVVGLTIGFVVAVKRSVLIEPIEREERVLMYVELSCQVENNRRLDLLVRHHSLSLSLSLSIYIYN